MKKLLSKLKHYFFYKTRVSRCGDYTITDVSFRFRNIRPKRKYKTIYTVVEEEAQVICNK